MATLLGGTPDSCAIALLGAVVSSEIGRERVAIRLTEIEAYGGVSDAASHAFTGPTPRNEPMWGPAGGLYVYLSYGVHWCANIVVGPEGTAAAVLLRGGQIIEGRDTVVRRRGRTDRLVDGPGKLAQALGLNGRMSGSDIWDGPLSLEGPIGSVVDWMQTPRIGISKAVDRPWRFVAAD